MMELERFVTRGLRTVAEKLRAHAGQRLVVPLEEGATDLGRTVRWLRHHASHGGVQLAWLNGAKAISRAELCRLRAEGFARDPRH